MADLSPISNYLCNAIDSAAIHIGEIAPPIGAACDLITKALLSDRKLIICGNGYSAPLASLLTTCLMHQQEFERPSLPAINISVDSTIISAIAKDEHYQYIYSKQVRAIGNEGDIFIALSVDGECSNIIQAIKAARDKHIKIITIIGFEGGKLSAIQQEEDIEVQLFSSSMTRALEAQLLTVNALCHQIESQLFGISQ